MNLPFTTLQFFEVFKEYNFDVFPAQVIFYLLAVIALILIRMKIKIAGKFSLGLLGIFWLWMGIVYHLIYFSSINKAAYLFGAVFIIQGVMFFLYTFRKSPSVEIKNDKYGFATFMLALFALLIYPTLGFFAGHHYPSSPTFGLPCPTTIFTFGILLTVNQKVPVYLFIIPVAWSIIGFTASFTLGVYEDVGLLISAIVFLLIIRGKNRTYNHNAS